MIIKISNDAKNIIINIIINFSNFDMRFLILYFLKSFDNLFRSSSGTIFVQSLSSIFDTVSFIIILFGIYLDLPDRIIPLNTISHGHAFNVSK